MPVIVKTNLPSMTVQQNLNSATSSLNKAVERMTTGYKINHAVDNAAGYSISDIWQTKLGSVDIASQNTTMGLDLLRTAEDNYALITTHLQRIRDLTEQAANGTYGLDSLETIRDEIKARLEEISRVATNAEYNEIKLMSTGSAAVNLQVGIKEGDVISMAATLFADATLNGLYSSTAAPGTTFRNIIKAANNGTAVANLNTETGYTATAAAFAGIKLTASGTYEKQTDSGKTARDTLEYIDYAIQMISTRVTKLGAAQNRLESVMETLTTQSNNITSSLSTIKDTDVAQESSNYIQAQILQQASATLLATANQAPSIAISLI